MNKTIYIVKGKVTDPEAHDNKAQIGDTEWQFSDGPSGERSSSADYLDLFQGIEEQGEDGVVFEFENFGPEEFASVAASCKPVDMFYIPETKKDLDTWVTNMPVEMPTSVAMMVGYNYAMRQVQRIIDGSIK